jgi:hypothetical protein
MPYGYGYQNNQNLGYMGGSGYPGAQNPGLNMNVNYNTNIYNNYNNYNQNQQQKPQEKITLNYGSFSKKTEDVSENYLTMALI